MNDKQLMVLTKVLGCSIFLLIGAFHYVMNMRGTVTRKAKTAWDYYDLINSVALTLGDLTIFIVQYKL